MVGCWCEEKESWGAGSEDHWGTDNEEMVVVLMVSSRSVGVLVVRRKKEEDWVTAVGKEKEICGCFRGTFSSHPDKKGKLGYTSQKEPKFRTLRMCCNFFSLQLFLMVARSS